MSNDVRNSSYDKSFEAQEIQDPREIRGKDSSFQSTRTKTNLTPCVLLFLPRWGNESSVEFNETYSKLIWATSFEDQMSGGNFKIEVVSGSNMKTNIEVKNQSIDL